jgi:hypothetical protein
MVHHTVPTLRTFLKSLASSLGGWERCPYNPSLSVAFCTIRFSSHHGCVRHLLEGEGLRGRAHAEMKERHPWYPYWLGIIRWMIVVTCHAVRKNRPCALSITGISTFASAVSPGRVQRSSHSDTGTNIQLSRYLCIFT